MRLISIDLDTEPNCLKELRSEKKVYSDLKDECLKEVRELLKIQQGGYCAYCEQKFKSIVFIEHYISQEEDNTQDLTFSNFLGVCSGKFYLDKNTGEHIEHCDTSRGAKQLQINPKLENHINTILYDENDRIRSTNPDFDEDINSVLNLNFKELVDSRNKEFMNSFDNLLIVANQLKLSKKETFEKGVSISGSGIVDFPNYLHYRYKALLDNIND